MTDQPSGVQSVARAFALLDAIGDLGGQAGIADLTGHTGLSAATVHRLLRTMTASGQVRQLPSRQYALGPSLIRLGARAQELLGTWARPVLADVVARLGETANLAVLDQDRVVYIAQAPSPHSMRMFTEVGRRVLPHCTGVGKALLAQLPDADVRAITARTGLPAQTSHTITTVDRLVRELARIRRRGYALDDSEQEIGVRCIAVSLPDGPPRLAVSISGPAARLPNQLVEQAVGVLHDAAGHLSRELERR